MSQDQTEVFDAIQTLRAALWIAYDGGGLVGNATHPVEVTRILDETGALLKKHGQPDELKGSAPDDIV